VKDKDGEAMNFLKNMTLGAMLIALILMTAACDDSGVTAPEGSTITLTPSPGTITIDQVSGETAGQSTLVAQVVDGGGLPVDEIPLFFSTTGGKLASVDNICVAGPGGPTCSKTGLACVTTSDCEQLSPLPVPIETNDNGVARDTLELQLFGDPDSVQVTAKGTNLEATGTVTKTVNLGPTDPDPIIAASPPSGQLTGRPFSFDGSGSVVDPQVEKECYDWAITSSLPVFASNQGCLVCALPGQAGCSDTCRTRGKFETTVNLTIGVEGDSTLDQSMTVELRVSDDPTVDCTIGGNPDPAKFGPNVDTLSYRTECDLTNPNVNAGPDQSGRLDDPPVGRVEFTLSATGADPESPTLDYLWVCTNGSIDPPDGRAQTVICTYTTTTAASGATATVTVTNRCGRQDTDAALLVVEQ
jgi:hypothetical protein